METKSPEPICPKCGTVLPADPADLWQMLGKWYCTQYCAQKASTLG